MTGKEFTKQAKELGAKVKKVNSAYWGKTWWEAEFIDFKVVSYQITFEENQAVGVRILGKNDNFADADDLEKAAAKMQEIAAFVRSINLTAE